LISLKDRRVLVVGLGRSGIAASRLLVRNNARVTATDRSPWDALSAEARELAALGIKMEAGCHVTETFLSADLIILSPGVPKEIAPLIRAKESGVKIISEIELGYQFLDAPLIAVTGSNGKSTTTTLIGEILKAKGERVFVGGNIGTPLTEYILSGGGADCVVAELSSFQLETIGDFRPSISILLNISPDHLDRYPGIQEYAEAKFRIFENQTTDDFAVINGDEPWSREISARFRGKVIVFSRKRKVENGVFSEEGRLVSNINDRHETLCEISGIGIKGVHNLENSMAAAAAALLRGCPPEIIARTLSVFPGLEHRLEFVREIDGVKYINDSKGTNVGAVIKSIEGFNEPILLIAGGRDKGSDFSLLRTVIREKVKRLILIGEAREKLRRAAGDLTTTIPADSMEEAVHVARKEAARGDVVLLSPACASFDMFRNFEDRGRIFKEIVWKLPPVQ